MEYRNMASIGKIKTITFYVFVSLVSGVGSITVVNITARTGQNISLPCDLNSESANVVQMQWHREVGPNRQEEIIVVYNPMFGEKKQTDNKGRLGSLKNSTVKGLRRFYLDLEDVEPGDSGLYVCDIITFPQGTIRQYVNLKVKDEEHRDTTAQPLTTEVPHGRTTQFASTKNSSTVINATFSTSVNTEGISGPSHSVTSSEASNTLSMSYTSGQSEPKATTWSPVSQDSNVTIYDSMPRTDSKQSTTYITDTESQSWTGTEKSTQQWVGLETQKNPHETTTIITSPDLQSHGNTTMSDLSPKVTTDSGGIGGPVIITLSILVVALVLGCVYRRYLLKKKMDLPPPFKPPPPPVKYTSVRTQNDIHTDILA